MLGERFREQIDVFLAKRKDIIKKSHGFRGKMSGITDLLDLCERIISTWKRGGWLD